MTACALCPFPCPPGDRLPFAGGLHVHAACALDATLTAVRAGMLPRAAVLLKRRVNPNKEIRRG